MPVFLLLCVALSLTATVAGVVCAQVPQQPERLQWRVTPKPLKQWLIPAWPDNTPDQLFKMEHQLYNRTYAEDTAMTRVLRLEQSLGLLPDALKPSDRLIRLISVFDKSQQQPVNQKNRVDIGLLENRLLQNRFDTWPLTQRLSQLEQMTFGQVYDQESQEDRLHRLFEQIPLGNKAVRFTNMP